MFIRWINQVEEIGCDREREFVIGQLGAGILLGGERRHQPLELFERGDAVLELPSPVIPVGIGNPVPETPSGRVKFFKGVAPGSRWRLILSRSWRFSIAMHYLQAHYRIEPNSVKRTTISL